MLDSPYWVGFSAESWGRSWGFDVEVDEEHGGGGSSTKKRKKKEPIKSRDDRDLLEMLSIIMTTGIIHNVY